MDRHWARITALTGHSLDVGNETFKLRNIMEAPLLKYKEEIEVQQIACMVGDWKLSRDLFDSSLALWNVASRHQAKKIKTVFLASTEFLQQMLL